MKGASITAISIDYYEVIVKLLLNPDSENNKVNTEKHWNFTEFIIIWKNSGTLS